jgi:hypothetical protein
MKKLMLILLLTFVFLQCLAPEFKRLSILKTKEECIQLTWSNVDFWLDYYRIENSDIVKAQIWLETGNFSSKFCRENNNLFGMKLAKKRPTTAIGKLDGMAYYPSWVLSIQDYKLWQTYFYQGENYYDFLHNRGYAEDPHYIRKLKQITTLISD